MFKLNIDKSNLFDELSTLNQVIKSFNFSDKNQSHDMIWCNILKNDKFPLMLKIIESALCISISNASVNVFLVSWKIYLVMNAIHLITTQLKLKFVLELIIQ